MRIERLDRIADIAPEIWDGLAGHPAPGPTGAYPKARPKDPFTTHRFLSALEDSGSVGPGTGWQPQHLLVLEGAEPVAAMPLYLKVHSLGEYIFDHAFAEAWMRAGGRYYPKLQTAVPFTPVTGPRLLGAPRYRRVLLEALKQAAAAKGLSSAHITFCTEDEAFAGRAYGFLHRVTTQYHWHNAGYRDFEAFLASLSASRRKTIRKERKAAQAFGGTIRALTGDAFTPAHWDAVWAFYQDTGARKWGRPYLTRAFFDRIHATMRADVLLFLAEHNGRPVAGALNFIGAEALFGRYWGALEHHPFLHFELCYYQAIDWAIAEGLARVEAGAQGEHKLLRGYVPVAVHSLHWFADARFQAAVREYLVREGALVKKDHALLQSVTPYRHGPRTDRKAAENAKPEPVEEPNAVLAQSMRLSEDTEHEF